MLIISLVELSINPELFAIIPEPTKEDFVALKESIESTTQHKSIIVWKDPVSDKIFIIDGHSRYEACKQLGIEPLIEHKEFENWFDAMRYAIHVNSKRRHLTQIQKVILQYGKLKLKNN